jgi:tRNA pseudouridine55 synthase
MPVRQLAEAEVREVSYGRTVDAVGLAGTYGALAPDGQVAALLREDAGRARPVLVFVAAG